MGCCSSSSVPSAAAAQPARPAGTVQAYDGFGRPVRRRVSVVPEEDYATAASPQRRPASSAASPQGRRSAASPGASVSAPGTLQQRRLSRPALPPPLLTLQTSDEFDGFGSPVAADYDAARRSPSKAQGKHARGKLACPVNTYTPSQASHLSVSHVSLEAPPALITPSQKLKADLRREGQLLSDARKARKLKEQEARLSLPAIDPFRKNSTTAAVSPRSGASNPLLQPDAPIMHMDSDLRRQLMRELAEDELEDGYITEQTAGSGDESEDCTPTRTVFRAADIAKTKQLGGAAVKNRRPLTHPMRLCP